MAYVQQLESMSWRMFLAVELYLVFFLGWMLRSDSQWFGLHTPFCMVGSHSDPGDNECCVSSAE
ncbi:hypothetical protein PanWU01x14_075890 [Parasponia andersonii]|uniref:Transmembrane protein n=1 Tax=Parasponia andersonii TaxID=3476 RepID=A0A2P5DD21_PARAD|nr:hypothetical protein PanWU01x14_075890 [Parasponia andersonii]